LDKQQPSPAGYATTLRAALNAGLMNGLLFGLVDGVIAGMASKPGGVFAWLGCLGLAVMSYGALWVAVLLALSPGLHPLLRSKTLYGRFASLLSFAIGLGLFLELYWWTRPYFFTGRAAFDPRRLAVAVALLLAGLGLAYALRRGARYLPGALRMSATLAVPILWAIGGLYLFTVRSSIGGRGVLGERNRDLPNVLLIVCDALRADVLGAYGSTQVKTPVLDELARGGVVFDNATVTAPFTWASFGSILTGKYPRRHGLVKMDPSRRMLPNVTLPWHLKSARRDKDGVQLEDGDYFGATFMTGTLSHGSGLARGFDVYYEALVGHDLVDTASAWSIFRSKLVLSILRDKLVQSFDANRVINVARDWFVEERGKRFVSMVHLYSTHTPYNPPKQFRDLYCDPGYTGPLNSFFAEHRMAIENGLGKPTAADIEQIKHLYYAGVSQADAMIGELLAQLRALGQLDNTLVIVTSDHGESLGEHGEWEHNWPYQTNLRVPWILSWPGHVPQAARVSAGVQLIDLMPTVLDLMGLGLPAEAAGEDPLGRLDGVSLMPLVRGEVPGVRPFSFSENEVFLAVQDTAAEGARYKLVVSANADCDEKLLQAEGAPFPPQLYRLDVDPLEHQNLIYKEPEQARRLNHQH
jgi:arylsulfatase A-like enzyme